MRELLVIMALFLSVAGLRAQSISHIETTKKTKTLSESTVGKVLSVSGETFTSQVGSWIYTWSKEGKKINTRAAHQ